jgi:Endomembrane protein 70
VAEEENVELTIFRGKKLEAAIRHRQRLGESIVGDRRETSPYEITFGDTVEWRLLCKTSFNKDDLVKFKKAIQNNYFFEMFVEDLPMWGYIGDTSEEDIISEVEGTGKTYLFPHLHFYIGHNKNRIVSAKVTTEVSIKRHFLGYGMINTNDKTFTFLNYTD